MKNLQSPFKMKPGRGNNPKTGHGMPSQLMSGSPLKQQKPPTPTNEGIYKREQSGSWNARPYEQSISEDNAYVYRKNSQGGIVDRADKRNKKAVEKLRTTFTKDSADVMFRRNKNATVQNAITNTTTGVPGEQTVQTNLRKVAYDRAGRPTRVDASHARKSRMVQARDRDRRTM